MTRRNLGKKGTRSNKEVASISSPLVEMKLLDQRFVSLDATVAEPHAKT